MQSLQCQQLELECITSLGEEILSTCHPDSIITIKSWVTVAKSRFQEVREGPQPYPCLGGTHTWGKHGPITHNPAPGESTALQPWPQLHTCPTAPNLSHNPTPGENMVL